MASTNIILIATVVTLAFVENAPSNTMKTASTQEELRSRVVFIDRDADDQINSYPQVISYSTLPPMQTVYQEGKSSLTKSQNFAKSLGNYPKPITEIKTSEPSVVSEMDDRRIWGLTVEDKNFEEDESYYNRPLSLPKNIVKIQSQAKKIVVAKTLEAESPIGVQRPSACDMSIIICCNNPSKLKECFKSNGCTNATEDMFQHLCSADSIRGIINDLAKYYKSNQEN